MRKREHIQVSEPQMVRHPNFVHEKGRDRKKIERGRGREKNVILYY